MNTAIVKPQKQIDLETRMTALGLSEDTLVEKFILGSGKGGQKINKTFSCVYLRHIPTGIEVKCQKERSQSLNRFMARRQICDKIEAAFHEKESKELAEQARIRKQKKRRSRKTKEKILQDKRAQSLKKESRKPPISG